MDSWLHLGSLHHITDITAAQSVGMTRHCLRFCSSAYCTLQRTSKRSSLRTRPSIASLLQFGSLRTTTDIGNDAFRENVASLPMCCSIPPSRLVELTFHRSIDCLLEQICVVEQSRLSSLVRAAGALVPSPPRSRFNRTPALARVCRTDDSCVLRHRVLVAAQGGGLSPALMGEQRSRAMNLDMDVVAP